MTLLPRSVLMLLVAAFCAAPVFAQQVVASISPISSSASDFVNGAPGNGAVRSTPASGVSGDTWFLNHFGLGTFGSPLGFGGRIAVSLSRSVNLRAGASYFSFTTTRTVSNIPFTANVRLQSEQAVIDWYPFYGGFHVSPGILFGSSNRAFGGATVPAGNSFTLNNVTYYSGSADPVQASGAVDFRHTAPMLTVGWGNWIRHPGDRREHSHLTFPFEAGVAFTGDPKTELNYTGVVCSSASQQYCSNIATDPPVQVNIRAERTKLQNDANWLRFYPIIAGGIVYRF
jgi:hypothetical protein